MMIEVFKTNVKDEQLAGELSDFLRRQFPASRVNFDLHDCDHILRMEGNDFTADRVLQLLRGRGLSCNLLD